MGFFASTETYTHYGSFYGIPVYLGSLTDEIGLKMEGTNWIFDRLVPIAAIFHNYVVEFTAQLFAAMLNRPYEPGFPITVKGELVDAS